MLQPPRTLEQKKYKSTFGFVQKVLCSALCQYRYYVGIHLGIRNLDQNRKMTAYVGIGATKPQ